MVDYQSMSFDSYFWNQHQVARDEPYSDYSLVPEPGMVPLDLANFPPLSSAHLQSPLADAWSDSVKVEDVDGLALDDDMDEDMEPSLSFGSLPASPLSVISPSSTIWSQSIIPGTAITLDLGLSSMSLVGPLHGQEQEKIHQTLLPCLGHRTSTVPDASVVNPSSPTYESGRCLIDQRGWTSFSSHSSPISAGHSMAQPSVVTPQQIVLSSAPVLGNLQFPDNHAFVKPSRNLRSLSRPALGVPVKRESTPPFVTGADAKANSALQPRPLSMRVGTSRVTKTTTGKNRKKKSSSMSVDSHGMHLCKLKVADGQPCKAWFTRKEHLTRHEKTDHGHNDDGTFLFCPMFRLLGDACCKSKGVGGDRADNLKYHVLNTHMLPKQKNKNQRVYCNFQLRRCKSFFPDIESYIQKRDTELARSGTTNGNALSYEMQELIHGHERRTCSCYNQRSTATAPAKKPFRRRERLSKL